MTAVAAARQPRIKIDQAAYLKAIAHPLRIRILAMLGERAASPVELEPQLDATLGAIAYHVRTLHTLGLIELVETRQRRGAIEHVYRADEPPRFSDEAWQELGPVGKQRLLGAMLQQIGEFASRSAAAGGFDRADANISRFSLELDEEGWQRLAQASKRWMAEIDEIEHAATQRAQDDSVTTFQVGLALLLFEAVRFSDAASGTQTAAPHTHESATRPAH